MTPEGMVHALDEIHRLLKPNGSLVDIHPFSEAAWVEVHQDGRTLFAQPLPDYSIEDYQHADSALAQAVKLRKFAVAGSGQFDFRVYASSVDELRDHFAEANAFSEDSEGGSVSSLDAEFVAQVEEIMAGAGNGAEVSTREKIHIARLKPV